MKTQPIAGEVIINEYYRLNMNESQVFNYLLNSKFEVSHDTGVWVQEYLSRYVTLYKIDNVKLNKGKDSLKIIRFRMTNHFESTNTFVLNTIDYYQQVPVEEKRIKILRGFVFKKNGLSKFTKICKSNSLTLLLINNQSTTL